VQRDFARAWLLSISIGRLDGACAFHGLQSTPLPREGGAGPVVRLPMTTPGLSRPTGKGKGCVPSPAPARRRRAPAGPRCPTGLGQRCVSSPQPARVQVALSRASVKRRAPAPEDNEAESAAPPHRSPRRRVSLLLPSFMSGDRDPPR
jgi:hypothetical protein